MPPVNVQVVHLILQMQPDVDFKEKLLKDNQAQEICKNLRIYLSFQEEFVNFHESQNLVYRNKKRVPALTAKYKKMHVDWIKKKSNINKGEMGNRGVFWWKKV